MAARRSRGLTIALAVLTLVVAGCGSRVDISFDESGAPLARQADLSPAEGIDVAHAPDARVDVLVWLRGRGSAGEHVASLLTVGFPERTAAVPVLVRVGDVDGVRSVVVVEAIGDASGPLTWRRLWVFDYATGGVVLSSTYR
jgi:hypothetical protein